MFLKMGGGGGMSAGGAAAGMRPPGMGGTLPKQGPSGGPSNTTSPVDAKSASLDPFADLMGQGWPNASGTSKPTTPLASGGNSPLAGGSPMHQSSWLPPTTASTWQQQQQQQQQQNYTARHQVKPPTMASQQPNYGRTNFDNLSSANTATSATATASSSSSAASAAAPNASASSTKPSAATFDDLLGFKGFNFAPTAKDSSAPKTMGQMKKAEMVKTMDPERRKVRFWK